MHIAIARWGFGGLFLLVLCACLATVTASAAVPAVEASGPSLPSQESLLQSVDGTQLEGGLKAPRLGLSFYERRGGFWASAEGLSARFEPDRVSLNAQGTSLAIQFAGVARPARSPVGELPKAGTANFLMGADPGKWEQGVRLFGAVRYRELYPGIDLVYHGDGERLKADWIVAARAAGEPDRGKIMRIRWRYPGARKVEVEPDGGLRIETENGTLREQAPVAYQELSGAQHRVTARYRLTPGADGAAAELGFEVGEYDASHPLVIDPSLSFSTYIGGTRNEAATGMYLDGNGSLYVAGYTESTNTPTSSSIQNFGGSVDAYVLRLNAAGTALVYATFVGGSGDDRAYAIDVDATGAAYVVGSTTSANFPNLAALQPNLSGLRDGFIFKLNPAGNALVYSTYYGGSGSDIAYGVALDPFAQPYIAGETTSTDFPIKAAYQSVNRGGYDAFTLKLNMNGALVYSTYLGGTGNDGARSIAVSANQLTAYITGYTWSTDFPLWNPAQAFNGGGEDAFLVRFNSDANQFVYSTYLGGSGGTADAPELGTAISVDQNNNVYLAGTTSSLNFPTLNPYQAAHGGGGQDAWVRKLDSGGQLVYSSYLGGSGVDIATSIRVDFNRRAIVGGYTSSANFPSLLPAQPSFGGSYDAFVTGFDLAGKPLVFSTTLGGTASDIANAVAVDPTTLTTYVAGSTGSINFPIQAPYRFTLAGATDLFVAKMSPATIPPTAPTFLGLSPSSGSGVSATFTVQVADANGANTIDSTQMLINSRFTGQSSCHVAYVPATNLFFLLNNTATAWLGGLPPGTATLIQNSQCSLNVQTATVVKLGNIITLGFPMTFSSAYSGSKLIYLLAVDKTGLRADWAGYGTWVRP